jgi:hypothetical protein
MSVETPQQPVQQAPTAPPPPAEPPKQGFFRRRLPILVGAVVLAGAAAAAILIFLGGSNDKGGTVKGPNKANAFTISYPDAWRPLSASKVAGLPGHPLAVLRRSDGKGYVVVRRERGTPPANLTKLGASLGAQLKKRVPDLQLRSTKTVKIRAGNALFTSYIRKKTGTVQSVVVVPAGNRTFTLNTVSRGGANNVAREIGRMILSFDAK